MNEARLLEHLRSGKLGVRWRPPSSWEIRQATPYGVTFVDRETGLSVRLMYLPLPLCDPRERGDLLREDFTRAAKILHQEDRRQPDWRLSILPSAANDEAAPLGREAPRDEPQEHPTTVDSDYDPVLSLKVNPFKGGDYIECIFHLRKRPTDEIICASYRVPIPDATLGIDITARSHTTGYRESYWAAIKMMEMRKGKSDHPFENLKEAYSEEYDHLPGLLSGFRRYLVTFRAHLAEKLELLVRQPQRRSSRQLMQNSRCRITLPPRFMPTRHLSAGRFDMIARASMDSVSSWRLGVMRGPDLGAFPPEALVSFAEAASKSWFKEVTREYGTEGARSIRISVVRGDERGFQVEADFSNPRSRFCKATYMRWFFGEGGVVFRIDEVSPPGVPRQERVALVEQVLSTFEQLR